LECRESHRIGTSACRTGLLLLIALAAFAVITKFVDAVALCGKRSVLFGIVATLLKVTATAFR
jgi:hypothetical protein